MQVLIKPLVTEKAAAMNDQSVFVFVVNKNADKGQIKKAVEDKYDVKVDSVRTAIMPGKSKTRYTKTAVIDGRTSSFKKAMVKLADGEVIDIYENM